MADKKLAFKALIAPLSEIPLKVSFPSNYVLRFISAFRQTASEAFGGGEKKTHERTKERKKKNEKRCAQLHFFFMGVEFVMKKLSRNGIKWRIYCPFIFFKYSL